MLNVALSVIMLSAIMQSVIMLSVFILSVIMLSVIMLSVITLNVITLSVIVLSVIMLSAIMLSVATLSVVAPWPEVQVLEAVFHLHQGRNRLREVLNKWTLSDENFATFLLLKKVNVLKLCCPAK